MLALALSLVGQVSITANQGEGFWSIVMSVLLYGGNSWLSLTGTLVPSLPSDELSWAHLWPLKCQCPALRLCLGARQFLFSLK